jgi:hypothetical protein
MFRYNSGKRSGNMLGYNSGRDLGKASGNMLGYDLGKILGSDLGMELSTVSDKGPSKNSGKGAGQDKMCKTRRFLCFGINLS